jgi:hypothetical protein
MGWRCRSFGAASQTLAASRRKRFACGSTLQVMKPLRDFEVLVLNETIKELVKAQLVNTWQFFEEELWQKHEQV